MFDVNETNLGQKSAKIHHEMYYSNMSFNENSGIPSWFKLSNPVAKKKMKIVKDISIVVKTKVYVTLIRKYPP